LKFSLDVIEIKRPRDLRIKALCLCRKESR